MSLVWRSVEEGVTQPSTTGSQDPGGEVIIMPLLPEEGTQGGRHSLSLGSSFLTCQRVFAGPAREVAGAKSLGVLIQTPRFTHQLNLCLKCQ